MQAREIKAHCIDRRRALLGGGARRVHVSTDTKVGKEDRAIGLQEEVAGLQVTL